MPTGLAAADWIVLALYGLLLIVSSLWFSRRRPTDTEGYFLGSRRMPVWTVSLSVVATSLSAASFIGVPQSSYNGNLTYLATNLGMIIAAIIVAVFFIPRFYAARVQTIYELIGTRFGSSAGSASSAMFLVGRAMSAGARIYIGAIPASIVLFGDLEPHHLVAAIAVLGVVGITYTLVGGVASVIWTDAIQLVVLVGACVAAIFIIAGHINAPLAEVWSALATGGEGGSSKLRLLDPAITSTGFDFASQFSLPACIIGFALLGIGSYGVDHDLVQRMLTCRSARKGAASAIAGILLVIPSVAIFLVVGLLLWVFYNRPDLTGLAHDAPQDTRRVFLSFIIEYMPPGLSGLMLAGLFAAGLSSLNSAINAMSSAFVNDHYRKLVRDRSERHYLFIGRLGVVAWGVLLSAFACFCVYWQHSAELAGKQTGLLDFALRVMTFAYAGLIAVFITALFTRRGNSSSVIAALAVGFLAVLAMERMDLAFVWKLVIATGAALVVCSVPRGTRPQARAQTGTLVS
ncbi:MAG: sodium:solute symporter [Phycisphaeraceae bacterium]|nr:sodium:solute symporter [Phycisphaeraceae bacterium]MCW5761947.1 sodium:solute symporter [Phycisphaeraceae bacterium]